MTIQPSLVLDTKDLEPYIKEYRRIMKVKDDAVFQISSIVPVTDGTNWTIEIKGQFTKE